MKNKTENRKKKYLKNIVFTWSTRFVMKFRSFNGLTTCYLFFAWFVDGCVNLGEKRQRGTNSWIFRFELLVIFCVVELRGRREKGREMFSLLCPLWWFVLLLKTSGRIERAERVVESWGGFLSCEKSKKVSGVVFRQMMDFCPQMKRKMNRDWV